MKYILHRFNILSATIVLGLLYFLLFAPVVYAQEGATTTNTSGTQITTSAESGQVALGSNAAATSQEATVFGAISPTTWDWGLRIFSALFLSAIGVWAIYRVFLYITAMQNRYYDVTQYLASRGQTTHTVIVGSGVPSAAMLAAPAAAVASDTPLPTPKKIVVKGPSTVTVNTKSADFTAFFVQDEKEVLADDTVTWQIIPEGAATLDRMKGSTTYLTAKQVGAFDLVVKTNDPATPTGSTEVHFPVAVIAPASGEISLPFIGEGWGTIILAILFGIIIALLGLSRVLSTELVGTLLGALLGYIFGMASPGRASGSPRAANSAPPSSTGTNPPTGGNG